MRSILLPIHRRRPRPGLPVLWASGPAVRPGRDGPRAGERQPDRSAPLPRIVLPPEGILIVDDDPFMLEMLPRKLKKVLPEGTRILGVATPEEALRIVRENAAGRLVVLSDFDLRAAMSGTDLLARVARESPATVRILFSGHSREEIGSLDDAVVHGFVEKPFRLDELLPPLLRILDSAL